MDRFSRFFVPNLICESVFKLPKKYVSGKKIRAMEETLRKPADGVPAVTVSIGIAFSDALREGENLFKNADRALYRVKESGRDGYQFYHD